MLRFLNRKLHQISTLTKDSTTPVFFFQNNPPLKSFSSLSDSTHQQSLTLSYLINSCGLSPESALLVSKKFTLKTTQKSDSVLALFKSHGLSITHISKLISKRPYLLSADPNKTLKPKIDFFYNELGISGPSLAMILGSNPDLLYTSLKNHLIPAVDFLKTLVHTNENVLLAVRRSNSLLRHQLRTVLIPNISILRNHGVPERHISKLITSYPRMLNQHCVQFREKAAFIKEMGIDPMTAKFPLAVRVMTSLSKANWERKMDVYRSLGWSEDEFLSAFRLQPMCMLTSEKKIKRMINFFVNELGWKPSVVSRNPNLLLLSMDKTIIPRYSVVSILLTKGLVEKDLNMSSVFKSSEDSFLKRFVIKYQKRVPELPKAYQGEMGLRGEYIGSEEVGRS